jgi:hypothetical protein
METYEFDNSNRMLFHPDFHFSSGAFTEEELIYLCKFYEYDEPRTVSFALGRTENSIGVKVAKLKKQGLYEYYKNKWLELVVS